MSPCHLVPASDLCGSFDSRIRFKKKKEEVPPTTTAAFVAFPHHRQCIMMQQ
jgi:hypothetical protein